MTDTTARTYALGDKVRFRLELIERNPHLHGVWVVLKTPTRGNEVNYTVRPDGAPDARGYRAKAEYLQPADEPQTPVLVPYLPSLLPGTLVKPTADARKVPPGYYVIVAEGRQPNTYRLLPLGRDDSRYWTGVHQTFLTPVENYRIVEGEQDGATS